MKIGLKSVVKFKGEENNHIGEVVGYEVGTEGKSFKIESGGAFFVGVLESDIICRYTEFKSRTKKNDPNKIES